MENVAFNSLLPPTEPRRRLWKHLRLVLVSFYRKKTTGLFYPLFAFAFLTFVRILHVHHCVHFLLSFPLEFFFPLPPGVCCTSNIPPHTLFKCSLWIPLLDRSTLHSPRPPCPRAPLEILRRVRRGFPDSSRCVHTRFVFIINAMHQQSATE